jgi:hypothetical protein
MCNLMICKIKANANHGCSGRRFFALGGVVALMRFSVPLICEVVFGERSGSRSMLCQFFSCLRFVVLILYSSTVWFERDVPCNCVQNGSFLLLHGFCDNIETVSLLCSSACRTQKE